MTRLLIWTVALSIAVAVTESRVRVLGDVAISTGYYTFTAMCNSQPDPPAAPRP